MEVARSKMVENVTEQTTEVCLQKTLSDPNISENRSAKLEYERAAYGEREEGMSGVDGSTLIDGEKDESAEIPGRSFKEKIYDAAVATGGAVKEFPRKVIVWLRSTFCFLAVRNERRSNIVKSVKVE